MVTRIVGGMPSLTIRFRHAPGVDPATVELPGGFCFADNQPLPSSAAEFGELQPGLVAQYQITVSTVNTPSARVVELDGVLVRLADGWLSVTGDDYDAVYVRYEAELQTISDCIG